VSRAAAGSANAKKTAQKAGAVKRVNEAGKVKERLRAGTAGSYKVGGKSHKRVRVDGSGSGPTPVHIRSRPGRTTKNGLPCGSPLIAKTWDQGTGIRSSREKVSPPEPEPALFPLDLDHVADGGGAG